MSKTVLVTGAGGFVGRYMVRELEQYGYTICGTGVQEQPSWWSDSHQWMRLNLLDLDDISRLSRQWWGVVHLAGLTVPSKIPNPSDALQNVGMTLGLLDHFSSTRFLLVSSALVYGQSKLNATEQSELRPSGYYGVSKFLCEQTADLYSDRLDVRIARPFNHLGSGMNQDLAVPSLVRRVLAARHTNDSIEMQGGNSTRDFIDVRDVVSAYRMILESDTLSSKVFNVCTGEGVSLQRVAETALSVLGYSREIVFLNQEMSTDETNKLVGDPRRLISETNWMQKISLRESIVEMVETAKLTET